jgi:SAM-dependent methyltransferase
VPKQAYIGTELELFAHAQRWKAYLASAVQDCVHGDVAEVGAGIGAFTKLFSSANTRSWTCIEPDATLLDRLRAELAPGVDAGRIRCIAGTLDDLGADARFDCILYIDVLEHILDDRAELARAAAHLAARGRLVVLSPAHTFLFSEFDRAIGHHRRYDARSLMRVVPRGLRCESLRYLDSVGILASLTNRFLLRQAQFTRAQIQLWDRSMVPLSRRIDPWLCYHLGKSILGIWTTA